MIDLILGGARSGKSRLAETRAALQHLPVTYIATATANDKEMAERIAHHKAQRPSHWGLLEEPRHLATLINSSNPSPQCLLIDCLTLWLTNWLMIEDQNAYETAKEDLLIALSNTQHHIILVSNETGLGVVPMGELSRRYVDESGRLHQAVGELADNVIMTLAGLPLPLKQMGEPIFHIQQLDAMKTQTPNN
ncbi:MAG: bifunctional adenosylcobinamide kinase/adenosylcobinamide-phosphate guanylyltransferase [Pseudomonadales bacterium]|nr:bifunctional adenosylcobinamide kinase/adenosylcobinamide-phosphate guanylyltransferase [Pseudomonadales bacterium]